MKKKERMSDEERELLQAAIAYARSKGIPLTKVSWALSSLIGIPDNSLYYQLRNLDQNAEDEPFDEEDETDAEIAESERLEHRVGDIVRIRVVSIKTYGVVCAVAGTTRTLLLHLSEIADEFIDDIGAFVTVGDEFDAMLIVNPKGQLGLSCRRVKPRARKDAQVVNGGN